MYLSESGFSPYVSYTESFQPATGSDFFLRPFEPTNAKQYEAGIKYEPAGANASVTLAVYELTQTNVSTSDLAHPGFAVQTGEIRSRGVELEGRASLNRKLDLVGSIGTTEAKVTKSNTNNVGTRPTSVPRSNASLWADYRFGEVLQGVSMGFGARYIGKQDPTTTITMGGYTVFDAALRYQIDNWRFALNVKNLANRTYLANCSFACFYGDERNFVLSAKYSW
jgi:iron complex outermembrane receptor protein